MLAPLGHAVSTQYTLISPTTQVARAPACQRGHPVGTRYERALPLFTLMAVVGQRCVGSCVVEQLAEQPVQQLERGVKIQSFGVAGQGALQLGAQASDLLGKLRPVRLQTRDQQRRVIVGQGAVGESVEQLCKVFKTGIDMRQHLIGLFETQTLEQLVQGIEARGDRHEFAVQAVESTVAATHVRVFEYRDAAQPFQADGFGHKAYVAGFEFSA